MIAFIIGREFRLSIAELQSFFVDAKIEYCNKQLVIFKGIDKDYLKSNFHKLGGSIKAIEIYSEVSSKNDFITSAISLIQENKKSEGKTHYAISNYLTEKVDVFTYGIQIKKAIRKLEDISIRFVNKNSSNINAATYKNEIKNKGIELNLIPAASKEYIGITMAYQDVDEYSKRDMGKKRDMQVGMLPPKLAQIMINLAGESTGIYDPFCGLGTILIESIISGKQKIYGSDINKKMVDSSRQNISTYVNSNISINIFEKDAKKVGENKFLQEVSIITEGYLGSIMTKGHVTEQKILDERKGLASIYEEFFKSLKKANFKNNIVISFPFWENRGKYYYFEEIYNIIKKYSYTPQKMLPEGIEFMETKSGSILYHRAGQQVGREIFKLKRA